jgi:uncharacterized repeat protein (TIGR01451 family)
MMISQLRSVASASVLAVAALGATPAFAAGTASGTTITNTVTLSYQVGSVSQSDVTANTSFTVDRKVNLTVAEVGSATTSVSPGQSAAVTTFTVTNNSNATLDFAVAVAQQVGGAGAHSNTDNFDVTAPSLFIDTNTNGVYNAGVDLAVSYLDEIAADASRTVFVVSNVPLGRATGDVAAVTLTATAREGGGAGSQGAAITETSGANTAGVDTVFADVAGATDAARDAAHSAKDDYTVLAASLTVAKLNRVISDPFNGATNPKMIPGATVEYCITVSNAAGSATATNVSVSDTLPATTTYDSGFGILTGATVSGGVCSGGSAGGSFSAGVVSASIGSITAGTDTAVRFRVTVN